MDPFAKPATSKKPNQNQAVNPFAKALAETERPFDKSAADATQNPKSLFSEALARTGGKIDDSNRPAQSAADQEKQRLEMEAKRKKEILRKKLHDQVNPVNNKDVFDAREKRVFEELEKTRQELKMLAKEIAEWRMDLDIEASKTVVNPGQSGTYYVSFFQQLRSFIMLLRQKVKSARTWSQQSSKKSAKKRGKNKPGMEMGGGKHEQSKTVFDMMHHERNATYGGS